MRTLTQTLKMAAVMALVAGAAAGAAAQDTYKPEKQPAQPPAKEAPAVKEQTVRTARALHLIPAEWAIGRNVYGPGEEKVGDINDLLISRQDGRIEYVLVGQGGVLGIGEKVIAVPYSAFTWNSQKKAMNLPLTADRLKGAPALEAGEWKALSDSSRAEATYTYFNIPRDTTPRDDDRLYRDIYRSSLKTGEMPLLRVSELKGKDLMANDGREVGDVEEIVFDGPSGRLAFVVVTFGGVMGVGEDKVAVPWTAFDVNKEGHLYAVKLDKDTVQSAPRLKEAEWGELKDAGYAPRLYKHYNLNAPWFDRTTGSGHLEGTAPDRTTGDEYTRLYTSGSDRRVTGTVESIDEKSPRSGMGNIACLKIKSDGGDTTLVHLAPKSYLDQNGLALKTGDKVTVRGRWVEDQGNTYLIATEITPSPSGRAVTIRNSDGSTPWSWR